MNRRSFLAAAGAAGAAGAVGAAGVAAQGADAPTAADAAPTRDLYELRQYHLATEAQKAGLDAFLRDAAIPALNRLGVNPVGVFHPVKDLGSTTVLLRHRSPASVVTSTARLLADKEYLDKGAAFLDAPADRPAFQRITSSLLLAFKGLPEIQKPVKGAGRVFQLRIYESPSTRTNQKKIEMFNDAGEIPLFQKVGLHPVFFGEALVGDKLPNLTYMLGFESEGDLQAAWKTFVGSPEWKNLSGRPEYADKAILSGITSILLKPADFSQI